MHALMISLDPTLLNENSDSRARHLVYAERAGHLTILLPAGAQRITPSPHLTLIGTGGNKLLYPMAAAWRGAQIHRTRPVDLIITQDLFLSGLAGVLLRGRIRRPLLAQNHSFIFNNPAWLAEHPLRNRLLLRLAGFVRARADFYRAVNRREYEQYVTAEGAPERAAALPLATASAAFAQGISTEQRAAIRAVWGVDATAPVVLWVGYPVAFKRVPLLFEVFRHVSARMPDARLVLIGDMMRSPIDLRAEAAARQLAERIIFHGTVPHHDLPAHYAAADVYAHTSSYEGVPRVLFEASAAGLPLVGMQAVGVDEVIEDGVNGFLVPDGDASAMAERIVTLLQDRALAARLGAAARERALLRYDAEGYPARWVDLWQRAAALGMRA